MFLVLSHRKEIRYSFIEVEGGETSGIFAEKAKTFGNIVYAQDLLLSFDGDEFGTIEVQAEKSVYNLKSGIVEISGNVKLKAKNIYAETKKAKIFLDGNVIKKIEGYENVKVETNGKTIKAEKTEIIPKEKVIIFTGNPTIYQKGLEIQGKIIKVFVDSDTVEIEDTKAKSTSQ
ncbi:MAG: LptA/OstA family protein [Candidatus Pacearchaeota archaeon]